MAQPIMFSATMTGPATENTEPPCVSESFASAVMVAIWESTKTATEREVKGVVVVKVKWEFEAFTRGENVWHVEYGN